jgi:inosine triphosphate pyrophosphatase
MKLNLITGNANKVREITRIMGDSCTIVNHKLDLPEIQGEAEEIARDKCQRAVDIIQGPVVIEDTSIGFDALNGLPGPYIKWFLEKIGINGLVQMLNGFENKGATGRCICAYCPGPGQEIKLFIGDSHGTIVEPRGSRLFGFDPIFQPDGYDQTYGELPTEVKNDISHRSMAFKKFRTYLETFKLSG